MFDALASYTNFPILQIWLGIFGGKYFPTENAVSAQSEFEFC